MKKKIDFKALFNLCNKNEKIVIGIVVFIFSCVAYLYSANNSILTWINKTECAIQEIEKSKSDIVLLKCEVSNQKTDIEVIKTKADLILKNQDSQEAFLRQILLLVKK